MAHGFHELARIRAFLSGFRRSNKPLGLPPANIRDFPASKAGEYDFFLLACLLHLTNHEKAIVHSPPTDSLQYHGYTTAERPVVCFFGSSRKTNHQFSFLLPFVKIRVIRGPIAFLFLHENSCNPWANNLPPFMKIRSNSWAKRFLFLCVIRGQ